MPIHPIPPNDKRREAHSNLEGDPRFLREHNNRATLFRDAQQLVEDGADSPRFPSEMRRERVSAAGVRLISISK
jgi:hypothetical protein